MMLPIIIPDFTVDPLYKSFIDALKRAAFSGEIRTDYGSRLAVATDNSIYQVIPQAVIFPKTTSDIALALQLSAEESFRKIKFSPRGGGTATNGQSLSSSIIMDCSKYMCNILELNRQEGWVRVQPGVVQDQLNQYLFQHGLYFAPEISPSNRATLGGMINTDACGNGQKIVGRTSDHVVELMGVLSNGTVFSSTDIKLPMFKELESLLKTHQKAIQKQFPHTPRTLSGYNLLKAYQDALHLNYLLCGSEGTLAVIAECKLKVMPIPKYKKLVVIKYRRFHDALYALNITQEVKPLVIECIDERLLELAREDNIYFHVKDFIECVEGKTGAINLVEFIAEDEQDLQAQIHALCMNIDNNKTKEKYAIGYSVIQDPIEIKKLWELRKKSVGLISKNKVGTRRPIPFIEDTAVSPEKLVDYIDEVKALLDQYQLSYGMYGHVDAGCVHVRPALDLQLTEDKKLHEKLSEEIVALLKKYHGVMWGEHGMGFRVQFNHVFFGTELYAVVRHIKTLFDPFNKLNPGKVALPLASDEELMTLSGPLRAQFDKQIPREWQAQYPTALACNGNGACFNYATKDVMCPSFKVTQDRIHSPKGRAGLMREWLRQIKNNSGDIDITQSSKMIFWKKSWNKNNNDFSHEVSAAMKGCLGCKGCATQCPLSVDIPELKAKFLFLYYQRYHQPLRDYCIAAIEKIAVVQSYFPSIANRLLQLKLFQRILKKTIGLVDPPIISPISIKKELRKRNYLVFHLKTLKQLSAEKKEQSVIILQDVFTCFYQPELLLKTHDVLTCLGYTVYIAPFFINGKPYHVNGFLKQFERIVSKNLKTLNRWASTGIPFIGLDPSMTLTYRDEYRKYGNDMAKDIEVLLPQEWLYAQLQKKSVTPDKINDLLRSQKKINTKYQDNKKYLLLSHCTEKALCVSAETQWQHIFTAFGLLLKPLSAGCCGMAGAYGHDVEHMALSQALFNMDWKQYLEHQEEDAVIMATGYSCQAQAKRFKNIQLQHPIEVLWEMIAKASC